MKKIIKKAAAAALSLALLGSAMPFEAGMLRLPQFTLTAKAANESTAVLDETTGILTLSGNVVKEDVQAFSNDERVTSVVAEEGTVLPSDCSNLFENFTGVTSIDIIKADTSCVTAVKYMFKNAQNVKTIKLPQNLVNANVTSTFAMFRDCYSLTSIDVSGFDTSKVTDMKQMFRGCRALTALDLSGFDTSKVYYMNDLFRECWALTDLNTSGLDTSNVYDMDYMFEECKKLKSIDISATKVNSATAMFQFCFSLESLDLSNFNTNCLKYTDFMFNSCKSLTSLDISGFETRNLNKTEHMFYNCTALTTIDISSFDTKKVNNMNNMFYKCYALKTIYASDKFVVSDNCASTDMFKNCFKLVGGNGTAFDENHTDGEYARIDTADTPGYFSAESTAVLNEETGVLTLSGNVVLEDVQAYSEDERVTAVVAEPGTVLPQDSDEMFYLFRKAKSIDLSNADTSNVTDMDNMFCGCNDMTYLDISSFDTSNVTDMGNMFEGCCSLESLDLSNFDTSNVTNMSCMFYGCYSLTSLDVSSFRTSNVTDMSSMFADCSSMKSFVLSRFDTSSVTDMSYMFGYCAKLESLDLSAFDTSSVQDMTSMFYKCSNLKTIYVLDKWSTRSVNQSKNMFYDCLHIVGGNGTAFDENHTDGEYARIDTAETPGYLTAFTSAYVDSSGSTLKLRGHVDKAEVRKYSYSSRIKYIVAEPGTVFPKDCYEMFRGFNRVETIDLHEADTSEVTNMIRMFNECKACSLFDLTGWDTSNVIDMSYMFEKCEGFDSTYDVKGMREWNTDNLTSMEYMFQGCTSLEWVELGPNGYANDPYIDAWRTDNVYSYIYMFKDCGALHHIQILNFNLKDGAFTYGMFTGCNNAETLYFWPGFDIKEDMELDNTYGWTGYECNGYKISGDGTYAVIPHETKRMTVCYNRINYKVLDMTGVLYNNLAFVYNRPYVGNTGEKSYSYYKDQGYSVILDYSGWYDVENDRFMTENDTFQPDKAYIYRLRLKPDSWRYFTEPTSETLAALKIKHLNDDTKEYLEVQAAHLNEDGTLDFYANLKTRDSYNGTAFIISQLNNYSGFYPPEGSVYANAGYANSGGFPAYKLPKMYNSTLITTDSILLVKLGGGIATGAYMGYMGINGYEISIDGVNYENIAVYNCDPFSGLEPGTDYTISVRVKGKTEPFWSEKFTTESANHPEFVSNSMTLGGAISLNFYIDLTNVPAAKRSLTFVEFEVNGKKQTAAFDPNKMNSKKTAYGFTCMLNSVSMADDVKATVHYFDANGKEHTYTQTATCEQYLRKFNEELDGGTKLWELIKAINDYGYYMQKYLSKAAASPWTLGVDHNAMEKCFKDEQTFKDNKTAYISELDALNIPKQKNLVKKDLSNISYSLTMDSDTALNITIKPLTSYKGSVTVTLDGKSYTPKKSGSNYIVTIEGISAHKLADKHTVTVKTTNGTSTFKASALSYAYEGISDPLSTEEYNAMCALYEYYKASKAYKG